MPWGLHSHDCPWIESIGGNGCFPVSPARTPEPQSSTLQLGCFEDLQQPCGLGFSPTGNIKALHQIDGFGTFAWSEAMVKRISALRFANAKCLKAKQLHMLAGSLCKLLHDLALAPGGDVSQLPAFETPLGVLGGVAK
jgi:hypothetical protein